MVLIILKPIKTLNSLPRHRTHLPASQCRISFQVMGQDSLGKYLSARLLGYGTLAQKILILFETGAR
jgi:hypothetical protein